MITLATATWPAPAEVQKQALSGDGGHSGGDAVAAVCGLRWPTAVVRISWSVNVLWTVSNKERTRILVDLIKSVRSSKAASK